MSSRIQASNATVKALQTRLQDAYRRDDVRLVRRIRVLLDRLTQTASVTGLCERWGLSPSCLYDWQKAFLLRGLDSLIARHSGGRPEKLTPRQKKRLVELLEAGPLVVGCETACWHSVWVRVLLCVLPTGVRETRISMAYSPPYMNPMTWRPYEHRDPIAHRPPTQPIDRTV